jgi:hypothetical protein
MGTEIRKYPRTTHIEGSRLQPGDEDRDSVPFETLAGRYLVVEEKMDGSNSGVSFDEQGGLLLQSRGHYLVGGPREKQFDLFKTWARARSRELWEVLGSRYIMYGEWMFAKHTVFYDLLPHYFLEFDVLDREEDVFLSTTRRRELLDGMPVVSVPVLYRGELGGLPELLALMGRSNFKSSQWKQNLQKACDGRVRDVERAIAETDPSDLMEGLYIKVEGEGRVVERYKYVRGEFLAVVMDSGSHWMSRPIVPNRLAPGVDIFGGGGE